MKKVAALLLIAGVALTGCTASGVGSTSNPSSTTSESRSAVSGDTPSFSGPYAAELADAYAKSHSTFEREALADGKVTDAEQTEMIERFRTCLAQNGHRLDSFTKTGSHTITALNPDEDSETGMKQVQSCDTYAGVSTVGLIYSAMLTDPQNIDLVPKIIECFKAHHLVGSGYNRSDYEHGLPRFSEDSKNGQVAQCNEDPLNLTKGK